MSDTDGSPAKRLKETPAIPKVRKDPPAERAPDNVCASDDLDDKRPEKRKRDGSPGRIGKVCVKTRSGQGGGCSADIPSKERRKDDDDEDEGNGDGSEGGWAWGKETESNSGGGRGKNERQRSQQRR